MSWKIKRRISEFLAMAALVAVLAIPNAWSAHTGQFMDEEDFPSSSFGSPPAQPELSVRPHRPNPLAYEDQDSADRSQGRGLASAPNPEDPAKRMNEHQLKSGVQEMSLIAGDLGFFPQVLFVAPEIPVRLFVTGSSKKALCLMMDAFQIRRQVRSQKIEEITFTPTTPGKYRFYCPVNGIEGTLLVKERSFGVKRQKLED